MRYLFVFSALTWFASQAAWAEARVPELKSDLEKIAFLIHLSQSVPGLFKESAQYGVDLLDQLEQQMASERQYAEDEEYQQLLGEGRELVELRIRAKSESTVSSLRIDPEAIEKWQTEMKALWESLPQANRITQLETSIKNHQTHLSGRSASGLLNGLLSTIPPENLPEGNRSGFFRLSPQQQETFLRENLPANLVERGFEPTRQGLSSSDNLQPDPLVDRWKLMNESETELSRLTQLHILLQHAEGTLPNNESEAQERLKLNEGTLDLFVDQNIFRRRLEILKERTNIPHREINRTLMPLTQQAIQAITKKQTSVETRISGELTLQEVPPYIARFRGCVGGDCSTDGSAEYANSPKERVFFVQDKNGMKGYVAATEVLIHGKPSLYVHTIQGARFTAGDVQMIYLGLHAQRAKLGVETISTIQEQKINGNINFSVTQNAVREIIRNRNLVDITHPDAKFRDNLPSVYDYDYSATNRKGHIFEPPGQNGIELDTQTTNLKVPQFTNKKPTSREIVLFALDLAHNGSEPNANRVIRLADPPLTKTQFETLFNVLKNKQMPSPYPLRVYYQRVEEELAKHGIALDETFYDQRSYLLYEGHLATPEMLEEFDSLSPINKQRTVSAILDQIETLGRLPSNIRSILEKNPAFFSDNQRIQNRISRLTALPPNNEDIRLALELMSTGIQPNNMLEFLRPFVLRMGSAVNQHRDEPKLILSHLSEVARDPEIRKHVQLMATRQNEKDKRGLRELLNLPIRDRQGRQRVSLADYHVSILEEMKRFGLGNDEENIDKHLYVFEFGYDLTKEVKDKSKFDSLGEPYKQFFVKMVLHGLKKENISSATELVVDTHIEYLSNNEDFQKSLIEIPPGNFFRLWDVLRPYIRFKGARFILDRYWDAFLSGDANPKEQASYIFRTFIKEVSAVPEIRQKVGTVVQRGNPRDIRRLAELLELGLRYEGIGEDMKPIFEAPDYKMDRNSYRILSAMKVIPPHVWKILAETVKDELNPHRNTAIAFFVARRPNSPELQAEVVRMALDQNSIAPDFEEVLEATGELNDPAKAVLKQAILSEERADLESVLRLLVRYKVQDPELLSDIIRAVPRHDDGQEHFAFEQKLQRAFQKQDESVRTAGLSRLKQRLQSGSHDEKIAALRLVEQIRPQEETVMFQVLRLAYLPNPEKEEALDEIIRRANEVFTKTRFTSPHIEAALVEKIKESNDPARLTQALEHLASIEAHDHATLDFLEDFARNNRELIPTNGHIRDYFNLFDINCKSFFKKMDD